MKKIILVTLLIASATLPARAGEGRWIEGYIQGNLEYFIDWKGMRLHIACPTKEGGRMLCLAFHLKISVLAKMPKHLPLLQMEQRSTGHLMRIVVQGEGNVIALINALRKGDPVVKVVNQSSTFPVSKAAKIIPATNSKSKKFSCNTMFSS